MKLGLLDKYQALISNKTKIPNILNVLKTVKNDFKVTLYLFYSSKKFLINLGDLKFNLL